MCLPAYCACGIWRAGSPCCSKIFRVQQTQTFSCFVPSMSLLVSGVDNNMGMSFNGVFVFLWISIGADYGVASSLARLIWIGWESRIPLKCLSLPTNVAIQVSSGLNWTWCRAGVNWFTGTLWAFIGSIMPIMWDCNLYHYNGTYYSLVWWWLTLSFHVARSRTDFSNCVQSLLEVSANSRWILGQVSPTLALPSSRSTWVRSSQTGIISVFELQMNLTV